LDEKASNYKNQYQKEIDDLLDMVESEKRVKLEYKRTLDESQKETEKR
jgi:hypothetical protein